MASQHPPGAETAGQETLFEFPCEYGIKAMGRDEDGFEAHITGIVLAHAQQAEGTEVAVKRSGGGKFIAVTVTIDAQSKDQLERIYQDLSDCEQVLVTL